MQTIEVMNPSKPRVGKASNQESFTNEDIAARITKFDAPDVDNAKNNEEKIANASAGFDYLEFAGMLVSNVSKSKGDGAARSMID